MKSPKSSLTAFFLMGSILLSGCAAPTDVPTTASETSPPTVSRSPSTSTPNPSPTTIPTSTRTPTWVPLPTLPPAEALAKVQELLETNGGCDFPCWWGITPGQTTLVETGEFFGHFGIPLVSKSFEGKKYAGIDYSSVDSLNIMATLTILDEVVENIQIKINPETQETGTRREWSAYSPETLITRYGPPTQVDFIADWGPGPFFSMQMYYDSLDLIIQYAGSNIIPAQKVGSVVCPLEAQFDAVWLWMGKNPDYPPGEGVPLEKVTSMTIDEFSTLMTKTPDQACFFINSDVFP